MVRQKLQKSSKVKSVCVFVYVLVHYLFGYMLSRFVINIGNYHNKNNWKSRI